MAENNNMKPKEQRFRFMQWNLLATGLFDDGFVQSNMFGSDNEEVLIQHLNETKDYRNTLEAAGIDLDLLKVHDWFYETLFVQSVISDLTRRQNFAGNDFVH